MQRRRIPSLDGIRAVAILMVIVFHICQRYGLTNPHTKAGVGIYFLLGLGGDGVSIFFVLSGFLITTLLSQEYEENGRISLSDFYLRRTFRILPPLYCYLLFLILFCTAVHYPLRVGTITGSAFFYRNYFLQTGQWLTEHTWSLCVEEQFYLLWPFALLWALHRGGKAFAAKLAAALIVVAPLLRIAIKISHPHDLTYPIATMLPTRMDALMSGGLTALLIGSREFETMYERVARVWWLLPIEFMVLSGMAKFTVGNIYRDSIGYTVDSAFIALFLVWVARNEHTWVGAILNSRLMVTLGVMSYSAYIWQTFFIHPANPTWANRLPWSVASIWVAAALSYYLIERPSLRLRRHIERRWRKDLAMANPA
jgi:peptidoglycan/LPS O-acetylase OafA/YrhL